MIVPKHASDGERQGGAEREHRSATPISASSKHLRQIDREHAAAGRAERLQGGDGVALAVEMAFDRVGDADAADQQRGQSDQGQELREALDVALELRRGVGAGADLPAGFRKLARALRRDRCARRRRSRRCRRRRRR